MNSVFLSDPDMHSMEETFLSFDIFPWFLCNLSTKKLAFINYEVNTGFQSIDSYKHANHEANSFYLPFILSVLGFSRPDNDSAKDYNLSFEDHKKGTQFSQNWFQWGAGYLLSVDITQAKSGKQSMLI